MQHQCTIHIQGKTLPCISGLRQDYYNSHNDDTFAIVSPLNQITSLFESNRVNRRRISSNVLGVDSFYTQKPSRFRWTNSPSFDVQSQFECAVISDKRTSCTFNRRIDPVLIIRGNQSNLNYKTSALSFSAAILVSTLAISWKSNVHDNFAYRWSCAITDAEGTKGLDRAGATTIYDQSGVVVAKLFGSEQAPVRLRDMPEFLWQAAVASEDRRFFKHAGIDIQSITRAIATSGRSGGGSSISQQLAKNLFTTEKRRVSRKIVDSLLALALEVRLKKKEILELYLNRVYYGAGAYGIEMAAQRYFRKKPSELNISEAATLIGLLPSPELLNPFINEQGSIRSRNRVLFKMRNEKFISDQVYEEEVLRPLELNADEGDLVNRYKAPFFVTEVVYDMAERFGMDRVMRGGLQVYTTLDLELQIYAEKLLMNTSLLYPDEEAAIVALDPCDGAVRVLIGGRDFSKSPFNRAIYAYRSPGSVFKPIVYLAALEQALPTDYLILDVPMTLTLNENADNEDEKYFTPMNYDRKFRGSVTLEKGLVHSLNVPTIALAREIGIEAVQRIAYDIGMQSTLPHAISLALGGCEVSPMELTSAYATLASGGYHNRPYSVRSVVDWTGNIIYQHKSVKESPSRVGNGHSDDHFQNRASVFMSTERSKLISHWAKVDEWLLSCDTIDKPKRIAIEERGVLRHWASGKTVPTKFTSAHPAQKGWLQGSPIAGLRTEVDMKNLGYSASGKFDGTGIERHQKGRRVIGNYASKRINHLLYSVTQRGTGVAAQLDGNRPCCGKTGTSNNHTDAWFVGYTPQLAASVWVGRDDAKPLEDFPTGGAIAAPIWSQLMSAAHMNWPLVSLPMERDHDEEMFADEKKEERSKLFLLNKRKKLRELSTMDDISLRKEMGSSLNSVRTSIVAKNLVNRLSEGQEINSFHMKGNPRHDSDTRESEGGNPTKFRRKRGDSPIKKRAAQKEMEEVYRERRSRAQKSPSKRDILESRNRYPSPINVKVLGRSSSNFTWKEDDVVYGKEALDNLKRGIKKEKKELTKAFGDRRHSGPARHRGFDRWIPTEEDLQEKYKKKIIPTGVQ